MPNLLQNEHFYPLIRTRQGLGNSLETPVWRFALLPYYRRFKDCWMMIFKIFIHLDQSECTNISRSKTQFLSERSLSSILYFYIYMAIFKPFQSFIFNSQLQYHIDEHSDLRTLNEKVLSKHRKEIWQKQLVSEIREDLI